MVKKELDTSSLATLWLLRFFKVLGAGVVFGLYLMMFVFNCGH